MSWSYDWCDVLMVVGAGVVGSTIVATFVERCPCILRLKPFASAIFSPVASVVCNEFTKRVHNARKPSNVAIRALTELLYAVFLVTTSANVF